MEGRRGNIMAVKALIEEFAATGAKVRADELLSKHLTMRVGGPAEIYIEITDGQQLGGVLSIVRKRGLSLFILGAGSNLVAHDSGLKGVVLRLKGEFAGVEVSEESGLIKAGAGAMLPIVVKRAVDFGLGGLECLAGIPGTLGGALLMNAGTKWGSISDSITGVETMDINGNIAKRKREDIKFGYRKSDLEGKIILAGEFALKKNDKARLSEKITEIMIERSQTQPLGTFNAGCVFKNPEGKPAGKLIDECGLKNFRIGGAYVSDRHANFIINDGKATASDIERLIVEVRRRVLEKAGISLELEIRLI